MSNDNTNSSIDSLIMLFSRMSGFQRSNRFNVKLFPPESLSAKNTISNDNIFAYMVQIPSQSILYREDNMSPSGPSIQIPLKRAYDDRLLIEFIIDSNWNIRKFFESWIDLVFVKTDQVGTGYNNSARVQYWNNIVGTVVIQALGLDGEIKNTITLYDAYPKMIIPTEMNSNSQNMFLTMMVDMNYRYYTTT